MGHSQGILTRSFDYFDIAAVLGTDSGDTGTLVLSPNINRRSRYKPYAFGSYNTLLIDKNGNENPILKANNFGMTPATIGTDPYRSLPWGQYTRPVEGIHCLRSTDLDNYFHYAKGGISAARIYTNNPKDDRVVMLGGDAQGQEGQIIGDIQYSFDTSFEICPEDFHNPMIPRHSLGDYRFTLLFGSVQSGDTAFSSAPWVAQSTESVRDMTHSDNMTETLTIFLDRDISNELRTWTTDSDDFLAILCLAPPIVRDTAGRFARWQIGSDQSNSLEFNGMGLVSLDMWEDSAVQTDSVLLTLNGYWDSFVTPATVDEAIGVSADPEYLTEGNVDEDDYTGFSVQMLTGNINVRTLTLDSDPFCTIWFVPKSKIRKVRQGIDYMLYDSAGRLVADGEVYGDEVVSSGGNGTQKYAIGFEQGISAEVTLPELSSGTYRLRLRAFVEQTEYPVRYVTGGAAYRQIMTAVDWTTDWEAEPEGRVWTEYKDINVTI